jgi:N-acetyl-gamma-glutamyl-phosphate/LysW-gamma-L-alpha-aminoadipyl-6-phosphate reductase
MTTISVMGGSGYVGGELLRLLISHPACELQTVTSQRYASEPLYRVHPNLRGLTALQFQEPDVEAVAAESDVVFTALPHGKSLNIVPDFLQRGLKVVDMTADFRLKDPKAYEEYYGFEHKHPELLQKSVYGLPELHRADIRNSRLVAVPGCMATAAILGLAPLIPDGYIDTSKIVIDAKIGSSGAGISPTIASHHSERSDGVRPYKVTGHRHIAEVEQELSQLGKNDVKVALTPHAVNMVRGILTTTHAFTCTNPTERDLWKAYRAHYAKEPFIRMVSDKKGLYGLPNPKVTVGTNFCDIGFEVDPPMQRVIVFTALDNLTKGAAGQAVQCFNIMSGVNEQTGLNALGLHP